ncbi:hypothetical protein ETAA8_27210 [Anatilimnocola aggregata]|uniref:Peptidase C-terminal archaeal/bacterial domain-containing protein n=1 Tax=Anatilimnocola aggregata TaxID=2528021 RepID=A0A517YBK1_9BACT|nr:hypothetical protein [Anatilimnocola aggregata]QDU27633.1 hypothetical protein ETAA8_27210 [Anatilimnocola aggregata]
MVSAPSPALLALVLCLSASAVHAQDKPPEKKDPPKVLMSLPLAISPGKLAQITLRGQRLDQATEVTMAGIDAAPKVEVKKKEKATVPNGLKAEEIGDSQVQIEFTLPNDFDKPEVQLVVASADGTSQPYSMLVLPAEKLVAETEPNEAFRKPGSIALGQTTSGSVHQQRDVDVFKIEGVAGETIVAEIFAARRGSALDPIMSLYDATGQLLVQSDDQPEHRDAILKHQLRAAGSYFLVLLDAHDRGSAAHPYLLQLRSE